MAGSITLLCGFPGCGKTNYASILPQDYVIICPDDFRVVLTGHEYFAPAEDAVWSHVKIAARVFVHQGKHVTIDATHLTKGSRAQWIKIANSLNVPIYCTYINTPFETCLERNNARNRVVPQDVMERMKENFDPPTQDEGFEQIYQFSGMQKVSHD